MHYIYPLNSYLPYFEIIEEYFGIRDCLIKDSMLTLKEYPNSEQTVEIPEKVEFSDLASLFDTWHFQGNDSFSREQYVTLTYFVANLYYGDTYYKLERSYSRNQETMESACYDGIRKEVLQLYIEWAKYKKDKALALSERYNWEMDWTTRHKEERQNRKKQIMKELEEEYGEIKGENWKKRQNLYDQIAASRLDDEMETKMRAEDGWIEMDKRYHEASRIHFRFAKQKGFTIDNFSSWFDALLEYHLFPLFLDDIRSIADAKTALKMDPGKKAEDKRLRAIVYGISKFFYDYRLVSSHAPDNLVAYIQKLLELMKITDKGGKLPSRRTIKKLIENLPNAKEDPKFYTPKIEVVHDKSQVSMVESAGKENKVYNWLFSMDPMAKAIIGMGEHEDAPISNAPDSSDA